MAKIAQVSPRESLEGVFSGVAFKRIPLLGLVTAVLGSFAVAAAGEPERGAAPPEFAIRAASGVFRAYQPEAGQTVIDEYVRARVDQVGLDTWRLDLTNTGNQPIEAVWFPWESSLQAVGQSLGDDVTYYPKQLGVAAKTDTLPPDEWIGQPYPGTCGPLIVQADRWAARMIAAVNWPPRILSPLMARGRMALRYDQPLAPQEQRCYTALCCEARGDEARGEIPWHKVLDRYKEWLLENMRREGLYPIAYPEPMWRANGWVNVQLQNIPRFDVHELWEAYQKARDVLPWVQFWGQMSNYHRCPAEGTKDWPDPPLEPGEKTGCCLPLARFHRRYMPDVAHFAREVCASGGIVGYYLRPWPPQEYLAEGKDSLAFLLNWIEVSREGGACAFYLDTLGTRPFGDPLLVARLFGDRLPAMSVIEWPVDIYPTAFLASGALWGGLDWSTEPGRTPADLSVTLQRVTFPAFGRYLLDDRVFFLGASNGDYMWWANYRGHQHWTERQAFLLGMKFDAPAHLPKHAAGWINPANEVVRAVADQWNKVGWWERQPRYRDRDGIYEVSPGIDVRRFEDRDGVTMFVLDNWMRRGEAAFTYRGRRIIGPPQQLCVMILPRELEPQHAQ